MDDRNIVGMNHDTNSKKGPNAFNGNESKLAEPNKSINEISEALSSMSRQTSLLKQCASISAIVLNEQQSVEQAEIIEPGSDDDTVDKNKNPTNSGIEIQKQYFNMVQVLSALEGKTQALHSLLQEEQSALHSLQETKKSALRQQEYIESIRGGCQGLPTPLPGEYALLAAEIQMGQSEDEEHVHELVDMDMGQDGDGFEPDVNVNNGEKSIGIKNNDHTHRNTDVIPNDEKTKIISDKSSSTVVPKEEMFGNRRVTTTARKSASSSTNTPTTNKKSNNNTKTSSTSSADIIQLKPVTQFEFFNVSKNTRGRITLVVLNEALADIERVVQTKYSILTRKQRIIRPLPSRSSSSSQKSSQQKYQKVSKQVYQQTLVTHRELAMEEHGERPWVSEQELRDSCAFFRSGESTARAILLVLRSVKRLKQVCGGQSQVTYMCL